MKLFRHLTEEEQAEFRQWARENYQPFSPINGCWHPVIQAECIVINEETHINFSKLTPLWED
jgi:hypothetical protein